MPHTALQHYTDYKVVIMKSPNRVELTVQEAQERTVRLNQFWENGAIHIVNSVRESNEFHLLAVEPSDCHTNVSSDQRTTRGHSTANRNPTGELDSSRSRPATTNEKLANQTVTVIPLEDNR